MTVTKKGDRYQARGARLDVLLICTAEPWLLPTDVREWLASAAVPHTPRFAAAFLLMEYQPGYAEHWPVFRLYGDLDV